MRDTNTLSRGKGWLRWRGLALATAALLVAALVVPLVAAAPTAQVGTVLRIGYIGLANSDSARGAQLAISQINDFGGVTAPDGSVHQLELVTLETMPSTETLSGALQTLIGQGVVALLGPDTNDLITPDTIDALVATGLPVLSAATGDALTDADTKNHIFRIRAPERVYSYAVAEYLVKDLGLTDIGVVQTQLEYTEAMINFQSAINYLGGQISQQIQLTDSTELIAQAQNLIVAQPDAVVMWGSYEDAAALISLLRSSGWNGKFAYRQADEAARAGILPDRLASGVIGFDAWIYTVPDDPTDIFVRDYIVTYGALPSSLAATSYDAMWFLRAAMRAGGVQPAPIIDTLIALGPQTFVHGTLHPLEFGNGDLSRLAVIYELGPYGGPSVVARFDDANRIGLDESGGPEPEPTATPTPAEPTATLEGTWVEVIPDVLNLRTGPGFEYDKVGELAQNERYRVLGAISDYTWLVIDYKGGVGWVKSEYVNILGELTAVSIVQPPPSPTPAATETPALPAGVDLLIETVVLTPTQPIQNQPFIATVTIRNQGADAAGTFAVAATWQPGDVYTATWVNGLAGGQSVQVQLTATLTTPGIYQVAVLADLNNDVGEINEGNNVYNVTYNVVYNVPSEQSTDQNTVGYAAITTFMDRVALASKPEAPAAL